MSVDETIIAWVGDEEVGEGDPVKVVAKVLDVLRRKTDLFLQENVEKKIWELIKVNRRKARAGGEGVKKGFFGQKKAAAPSGEKEEKEEEAGRSGEIIEEIENPNLQSLDQKLKEKGEEKAKEFEEDGATAAAAGGAGGGEKADSEKPSEPEADEGTGLAPNSGNGYTYDNGHSWVQTLQDVTLTIPVPQGTKARECTVEIKKNHLKVGLKSSSPEYIIDDELHKEIATEDSFWNISKFDDFYLVYLFPFLPGEPSRPLYTY